MCQLGNVPTQRREVLFMTFAGLRGAVSLCVALFVDHMAINSGAKDIVMFHTCM
eukprot:SAG22_NODE_13558_length_402_cov_1.006601_2_plen_54_part_00